MMWGQIKLHVRTNNTDQNNMEDIKNLALAKMNLQGTQAWLNSFMHTFKYTENEHKAAQSRAEIEENAEEYFSCNDLTSSDDDNNKRSDHGDNNDNDDSSSVNSTDYHDAATV